MNLADRVVLGFSKENGEPVRCIRCGSTDIAAVTLDSVQGVVSEQRYSCAKCGKILAYWAYGYFDTEDYL